MPKPSAANVLAQAQKLSKKISKTDTEAAATAMLAVMHPNASTQVARVAFAGAKAEFSLAKSSEVFRKASKAFERLKTLVKKIVCADLAYCKNKDGTSNWLKKNLPSIVGALLKGAPKGIVAKILSFLGLGTASWAAVVTVIVAWLLKTELDHLCDCAQS